MAQHDYVIANGTGAAVRSDLNNGLSAIVTQNSGATEPATTYAFMRWADTTAGVMKMRNSANNAWITLYQLDGEWTNIAFENGTAAAPSIYFKDSGTDTGFYSPGANQVGISTGGTARLTIDSNGNVDIDSNTLYVDATNNRVGLGTSSPGSALHVSSASDDILRLTAAAPYISFYNGATRTGYIRSNPSGPSFGIVSEDASTPMQFYTNSNVRMTIAAGGNVGIGTTSPGALLHTAGKIRFGSNATYYGEIDHDAVSSGSNIYNHSDAGGHIFQNGGTEALRIDASRRLLVGTSSAVTTPTGSGAAQLMGYNNGGTRGITVGYNEPSSTVGPRLALTKSRANNTTGFDVVSSGDEIGIVSFQGGDGSAFIEGARIAAYVDNTPGAGDMPGRMIFLTTADGASSPTERVRITSAGDTGFYNASIVYPNTNNAVSLGGSSYKWTAVWAVNGTIQTSDGREKTEVTDASLGSDFIKSLRPVSYKWIEGGQKDTGERDEKNNYIYESVPGARTHWGFIAQEVKEAVDAAGVDFGGWVLTDKDDPDSQQALRYDQFIAPLTKALQEALAKIETLEAKVAALEGA